MTFSFVISLQMKKCNFLDLINHVNVAQIIKFMIPFNRQFSFLSFNGYRVKFEQTLLKW